MGHRCNLVIVENGTPVVYYDHWAANTLDTTLFWGPERTLTFIRQREPVSGPLLDPVWGEGGAVLDLDRKRLTWFGGEDINCDIIWRRVQSSLMARNWPGWEIRNCPEGVHSIADAAGLPREGKLRNPDPITFFYEPDIYRTEGQAILTTRRDGETRATRLFGDTGYQGEATPDIIAALVADDPVPLDGALLELGAHLDFDRKECSFWSADDRVTADSLGKDWPGWTVTF